MSAIRPEVAASFRDFTARFEGVISHMYLDVKGLVTCGIGNLVDPMPRALALPWLRADGDEASQADIACEWLRVRAMAPGLVAHRYAAPDGLHLDADAIDVLVRRQLEADAKALLHYFPDFASYPASAQQALLSMAWALGAHFPQSFRRLAAAVLLRDWAAAAGECAISTVGNAGVAPRNAANQALFLRAAEEA